MIKIVKISSRVVSTIIIVVVVIPMILSLVLQNSSVQTWVVGKATTFLSDKIGSRISIGKIDIGKFYNIQIYDFFVESKMGRDTLLYTNQLTTRLSSFRLANNDMALAFVRLEGGQFNLYSADSMTNIKEIIERIRGGAPKKESTNPFKMSIGAIEIDSLTFRYQKKDAEQVSYGINYQDMEMQNISMRLDEFRLVNDSVHVEVEKITFQERGGITLNNLSLKELIISGNGMNFKDGDITIDNDSYLKFKNVAITYKGWDMADYINSVPMEVDMTESRIAMATVAKFTKQERGWKSVINFSGTFFGTVSSMQGHINKVTTSKTEILDSDYYIYGITDINNTIFDFTVGKLTTQPSDVTTIMSDFSAKGAKIALPAIVADSRLILKGYFLGKMRNFDAECRIAPENATDGYIKANLNLRTKGKGINVDGSVITNNLNTQRVLNNKDLERVTLNINLKGILEQGNSTVTMKGVVDSLLFKKYNYHSIDLNGELIKKAFSGYVGCDDPNLDFKFNGLLDFSTKIPAYNFNLDLAQADLCALGLNKRDTVAKIAVRILADGSGDNIDNLDASIVIDNLRYINHRDTTIAENPIKVEAANSELSKSITVTSDYFDLSFKGVHSYNDLIDFIKKSSRRFIPALATNGVAKQAVQTVTTTSEKSADDYYVITLDVKKANNLATIFVPSLTLAEDSKLSFIFNPSADSFSLNVSSKYIFLNNNMIYNIMVDTKNVGDIVNVFARAEEVYIGNIFLPNFSIMGDVQHDVITADFGFSNSDDNTYAVIKSKTTVMRNNGELQYKVDLLPSTLNLYRDIWKSNGGEVLIAGKRITVNNYSLVSTNQSLNVNGVISDNKQDTIRVTLDNFSLKPTALFASKIGFNIDGAVSGEVIGSAITSKTERFVDADLTFENNLINGISLADGHFYTGWEESSRLLNFNFESGGEKFIWGSVDTKNQLYSARVKIPEFDIALINPFLEGIAGNPVGKANVDVIISNPKRYLEINGKVNIPSLDATIIPTNVRYNISGEAEIKDNQYSLKNGLVKDADGGKGVLTAWMTNEKYKKVKYFIGIKANKMLGLNTTENDNSQFYGKAYASGDVTINGDRNKIVLAVDATSSKRSTFFLPLGGRTISEVNFIKFASESTAESETQRRRAKQKEVGKNPTSFEMKMRLTATPLLESEIVMDPITGSSIKATGNGLIDIDIQPANEVFTINGEYTIDKGTYRFILPNFNLVDKLFTIKNGSWIRWSGDPLNATLNVDAIYNVKASLAPLLGNQAGMANRVNVECVMALKGALTQPDISLGIEVPGAGPEEQGVLKSVLNTQEAISTQLFFLLFSNSFYATSGGTSTGNIGELGATTTGIEFLTSQINNIFSSEKFNLGINYRPQSDLSSNEFEVDFSAPILNNKLYIDVTGNYNFLDNMNSMTGKSQNWSGDVYITWLLNNSGNLSLKAFSKALDTFDENQGQQESGVGIYFKADFDSFKDLKLRYKDYIMRRKEAREEKKLKRLNNTKKEKTL